MTDRKLLDKIIMLQAYTSAMMAELADLRKELEKKNGDGNKKKAGPSAKEISEVLARRRKVAFRSS